MQRFNKAIAAVVAAVIVLLANFGFDVPKPWLDAINALVPVLGAIAVWAVPNKE
jgi:hypothetical protein